MLSSLLLALTLASLQVKVKGQTTQPPDTKSGPSLLTPEFVKNLTCTNEARCPDYNSNDCTYNSHMGTNETTYSFNYNDAKMIHAINFCANWVNAMRLCCDLYDGKLWEPEDFDEYWAVLKTIHADFVPEAVNSTFWWIGINNWSDNDGPYARYASNGDYVYWMRITDGPDGNGQNCVTASYSYGYNQEYYDHFCICEQVRFICESPASNATTTVDPNCNH